MSSTATDNRVQGAESRLLDLSLRDGRKLAVEIGGGIVPTPSLKRTIEGASTISIGIEDQELRFLRAAMLAEDFDAEIDGLHFRYLGTSKTGNILTLTLADRNFVLLSEFKKGEVKKVLAHRGKPNELTRAEFVKMLVEEAAPKLEFICPQLHVKQPVAKKAAVKKANQNAKERREPGIGAAKHLKIEGVAATPAQIELGETACRIADHVGAPFICQVAVMAALMVESTMGAASPQNVLQAEQEITGPGGEGAAVGSAEEEISGFLTGKPNWTGTSAIEYHKKHPEATFFEIAQAIQESGVGKASNGAANYGKFGNDAREWVEAFGGEAGEETGTGGKTVTEPFHFEVQKEESYWGAIKRLAKEVNWRAFIIGERFFFIDENELARGMVRLAIDPDTPFIPPANVDFNFNRNKKVTEVRLEVPVKQWKPPPGSVVTLAGYGPASIGFGDAPLKKGQKIGLSKARNVNTGEGRARYLVTSIEVPLTESTDGRYATIVLKKPTAPLPEPANSTKSVAGTSASGGNAPAGITKAIEECDRINAAHYPYSSPGARGTPPPGTGPYDCSGVTSRIAFVASGEPPTSLASAELAQSFEPGEGEWLTIFAKGPDGPSGHAFIRIRTPEGWKYFATSEDNPGKGAGWVPDSFYTSGYLAEFQKRHPRGL